MKLFHISILIATITLCSGCAGLYHSQCCGNGKYYRATRLDFKLCKEEPSSIPFAVLDLPFALISETIEVPLFITGLAEPKPPFADRAAMDEPPEPEKKIEKNNKKQP